MHCYDLLILNSGLKVKADSMKKQFLYNANIVTRDQILEDTTLLIDDGRIEKIGLDACPSSAQEFDLRGAFLMPGLIDLHGDGIERMIEPRPGVVFPIDFAVRSIDQQIIESGITTVYHALSFAGDELGIRNSVFASQLIRRIAELSDKLLVDHRCHCRYEVTAFAEMDVVQHLIEDGAIELLSLMDHTPGQGQFKTDKQYEEYLVKAYKNSPEDARRLIKGKKENRLAADEHLTTLIEMARRRDLLLASHDDDSLERVQYMQDRGVTISEFPLTLEVARAAYEAGMFTLFGSPNVVRGKSQSQGMRAQDAVAAGVATCLCSDYMHSAMLSAVFTLFQKGILDLPSATRLCTYNPAQAIGDSEIGEVARGKKANLIAVCWDGIFPSVQSVWCEGRLHLHR